MRGADYAKAEGAAYECLVKYCRARLPIDVERVVWDCCRARVMTYNEGGEVLGMNAEEFYKLAPSDTAFTIKGENRPGAELIMLTSGRESGQRKRFSLAHELGHIVLGHENDDAVDEREANAFAAAFLCPKPVLKAAGARDTRDVARAFGISLAAAKIALKNVDRPSRADDRLSALLERHFDTINKRRLEDFMDDSALAGYYASRIRGIKSPPISRVRPLWQRLCENALDDMERLIEARV